MKFGGRVYNMCVRLFVFEISKYNSPKINIGPLRRTLARRRQHCLGSVTPRDAKDGSCMDRQGVDANRLPTHRKNVGSSLAQFS